MTIGTLIQQITGIVNSLLPVLAALAFVVFGWGIAKFIYALGNGDTSGVEAGKKFILWSIIALFVLVMFWAILTFLRSEFGFTPSGGGLVPLLPTQ